VWGTRRGGEGGSVERCVEAHLVGEFGVAVFLGIWDCEKRQRFNRSTGVQNGALT